MQETLALKHLYHVLIKSIKFWFRNSAPLLFRCVPTKCPPLWLCYVKISMLYKNEYRLQNTLCIKHCLHWTLCHSCHERNYYSIFPGLQGKFDYIICNFRWVSISDEELLNRKYFVPVLWMTRFGPCIIAVLT